jgi:hypothetical protein
MSQINTNYLVYLRAHLDQGFCTACLAQLSPARVTTAQMMDAHRGYQHIESEICSGCGRVESVLKMTKD